MNLTKLFSSPFIAAIIGDANSGKSNFIYHLIEKLQSEHIFNLYTYGLRCDVVGANQIYSMDELERIKDSVILIDEFSSLFDLDDRRKKSQAERTMRLLYHNNNIILLSGLPENFKKFISARISVVFYKSVTFEDFINGSSVKKNIMKYYGEKRGSSFLDLDKDECLIYDGIHYSNYHVPYVEDKDTKKNNVKILVTKNVENKVNGSVD